MTLLKKDISRALLFGSEKLIEHKEELNVINVFPVPDSDTGSNLASMARSILQNSDSIGDAALDGARGNSGAIFAQFLYQLDNEIQDNFSLQQFVMALKNASEKAFQAVPSPKEGTILSVMKAWADFLVEHYETFDLKTLIIKAEEIALIALKNTTQQLHVLKKANVVDAGAQGFVLFIEGMKNALLDHSLELNWENIGITELELEDPVLHLNKDSLHNRYCTEVCIMGENICKDSIIKILEHSSDSIVVAGGSDKLRLHFHTNTPAKVFEKLTKCGKLVSQKVDDMMRQYTTVHERKHNIALIADSAICLPQELIDKHQIHIIPVNIIADNNTFIDNYGISLEQCLEYADQDQIKTSQPSPKAFADTFAFLNKYYDSIIVVTISKTGSGTHNSAVQGLKLTTMDKKRISIIDSTTVASSAGMLVLQIAEEISQGLRHETILDNAEQHIPKLREILTLRSIDQLIKGGRLKPSIGRIFQKLRLLPVITAKNGMPAPATAAFGFKNAIKKSLKIIQKDMRKGRPVKNYLIAHSDITTSEELQYYISALKKITGLEPLSIMKMNASLLTHTGAGGVSVGVLYH